MNSWEARTALMKKKEEEVERLKREIEALQELRRRRLLSPEDREDWPRIAGMINHQSKVLEDTRECCRFLRSLPTPSPGQIGIGSLVSVRDGKGEIMSFLFVPNGGGCSAVIGGELVTCVSIETPLARSFLGKEKKEGDIVTVRESYQIIKVQ